MTYQEIDERYEAAVRQINRRSNLLQLLLGLGCIGVSLAIKFVS